MIGLPQDLYNRCRNILLKSNAFDSDASLRSLFVTEDLWPFRGDIPGGRSNVARVKALLNYLLEKKTIAGKPVLPIFFRALSDHHQGQWLYKELDTLAQDLERHAQNPQPLASPPPPEGYFDVCIVCALPEEARAVQEVVETFCDVEFQESFVEKDNASYTYQYTTIFNRKQEPLRLLLSWPPRYGSIEMNILLRTLLPTYKPRFVAMTGICAGDQEKTKLGDLVVAEKTFNADEGKYVIENGQRVLHNDTRTAEPKPELIQYVKRFEAWQAVVGQPDRLGQLQRPPSKRQQREWFLNVLLSAPDHSFDQVDRAACDQQAPLWRDLLRELQQGEDAYLTADMKLRDPDQVRRLDLREKFPYTDPLEAKLHIKTLASVEAVRSDSPFGEIQRPVRSAIAIDMEAHAFYQAAADTQALVVKGVSDYANMDKDDSYHAYAAAASAAYILALIRHYVTEERLPRAPKLH